MKYFFQQQFILEQNISIRYFLDIHNYIHIYMKTVANQATLCHNNQFK